MLNLTPGGRQQPRIKRTPAYILAQQSTLLAHALATWPRRAAPLLEINCGDGSFLPLLWHSGFDVVATEYDPDLRVSAQNRSLPDCDVRKAVDDDLPFDDDSFDWVILHLRKHGAKDIGNCASEALRVTRRGLMLTFWNSASPAIVCGRIQRKKFYLPQGFPWWRVWRQIRALSPGRQSGAGILCGPPCTWNGKSRFAPVNEKVAWLPIGAWCMVRLDLAPGIPLTGLALRLESAMRTPQPAMEYSPKNVLSHYIYYIKDKKQVSHEIPIYC